MEQSRKIIVDGMSFIRSGRKYYYNSHTRTYLHRYLWEKEYGKIPDGYQVHHKDHDPLNNSLDNFELIKRGEHQKHHGSELTDEQREWFRNNLNEKARPAAIEWHKSDSGKEWHKEHYEDMKHKLHAIEEFKCETCGKVFSAVKSAANRFCSNPCKSKWRRDSGVDDVTIKCAWCDGKHIVNKYSKSTYCSKSCASKHRHSERQLKDSPNLRE